MAISEWIILELNEFGDTASYKEIEGALFEIFGEDCEHFIPIHYEEMGSYISTSILFQGYVFVKKTPFIMEKVSDLYDSRLFAKVLEDKGHPQTIDSRTIGVLRRKLRNSIKKRIKPGTQVKIMDGIFKNLIGEVVDLEDDGKKAMVKISRLSREMIAPIPTTSVEIQMEVA